MVPRLFVEPAVNGHFQLSMKCFQNGQSNRGHLQFMRILLFKIIIAWQFEWLQSMQIIDDGTKQFRLLGAIGSRARLAVFDEHGNICIRGMFVWKQCVADGTAESVFFIEITLVPQIVHIDRSNGAIDEDAEVM